MARESKAKKKARAAAIVAGLEEMYPGATCALHWQDPFQLLIVTMLSAQSTDERVNLISPELFRRFPDPVALGLASQEEVEQVIQSVGLYHTKANNIRATAQRLCLDFDGQVPTDIETLTTLPGVARKTANVVLGTAFGLATGVVVDTHVFRVTKRMGLVPVAQKYREKAEKVLMELIPPDKWVFAGHALILHGRAICTARKAYCDRCGVADVCPKLMT